MGKASEERHPSLQVDWAPSCVAPFWRNMIMFFAQKLVWHATLAPACHPHSTAAVVSALERTAVEHGHAAVHTTHRAMKAKPAVMITAIEGPPPLPPARRIGTRRSRATAGASPLPTAVTQNHKASKHAAATGTRRSTLPHTARLLVQTCLHAPVWPSDPRASRHAANAVDRRLGQ